MLDPLSLEQKNRVVHLRLPKELFFSKKAHVDIPNRGRHHGCTVVPLTNSVQPTPSLSRPANYGVLAPRSWKRHCLINGSSVLPLAPRVCTRAYLYFFFPLSTNSTRINRERVVHNLSALGGKGREGAEEPDRKAKAQTVHSPGMRLRKARDQTWMKQAISDSSSPIIQLY